MEHPITVCVTGAAGQIAYSFIPLLLTGQIFGTRPIDLKLLDIPQSANILTGVIMEINDGSYKLLHSVQSGTDPVLMFKDADVIVFLGGFPRLKGMQRKDLIKSNCNIFKSQGEALSAAKPDVRCVVVANPANTNARILSHFNSGKTPAANITCLTRLDHNRAVSQIAEKTGCRLTEIDNVVIFGNHSTTQYPSTVLPTVKGQPLRDVLAGDEEWLKKTFIQKVQQRGGEVLQVRGNSSVFSAANAVKDHLKDWYQGSDGKIVSMGVVSQGEYGFSKGVWTSLPVRCLGNFNYEIVNGLELTDFCKEKIAVSNQELEQEMTMSQL